MVTRRLASGVAAYYWVPPTWAARARCPVACEPLGTDYAAAKQRCDEILNKQFDEWRTRGHISTEDRLRPGTFDWMVAVYKSHPKYSGKPPKTRKSYDAALRLVSQHQLSDGRAFGQLALTSITPGATDRLFEKLKQKDDGNIRTRTAVLAMRVAQRAWNVAWRDKPSQVPAVNPFAKMGLAYEPKPTRAVTHSELLRFVDAADQSGEPSLGTAAMIAFYWLQREEDILTRLSWTQYKPADAPNIVRIFHHKTRELVDLPLYDEDGTALWPELISRLDNMPRHGTLIVTRSALDRRRKVYLPWKEDYFRHRIAALRTNAGIDAEIKFMGLRHGGNTEGADAELSDAQLRALSGHRTAAMTVLYAKQTLKQRRVGARKRLEARTNSGSLSK